MGHRLKIINIFGARPNLPKIAPLMREMQRHSEIQTILVHTGRRYHRESAAGGPLARGYLSRGKLLKTADPAVARHSVLGVSRHETDPLRGASILNMDHGRLRGLCEHGSLGSRRRNFRSPHHHRFCSPQRDARCVSAWARWVPRSFRTTSFHLLRDTQQAACAGRQWDFGSRE